MLNQLCADASCEGNQFIALKDAGVTKPAAQVKVDEGTLWQSRSAPWCEVERPARSQERAGRSVCFGFQRSCGRKQ